MWTYEFYGLDYELEPSFGPILCSDKPDERPIIEEVETQEIVREIGGVPVVETHHWYRNRLANKRPSTDPEERPSLPIHRAMARMLHANERYENRAFMPGGQFVAEDA